MIDVNMGKINSNTSEIVKKKREERGWTQSHLASASGLSTRTVQRLERGEGASKETLMAVASVLEIDVKSLTMDEPSKISKNDSKVILLPKIENGKQALDIVWGAHGYEMDHPHVTGELGALVGAFLQNLKDMGEIGPDCCGMGTKIEWAEDLDKMLLELSKNKMSVFGLMREIIVSTADGSKMNWSLTTLMVARNENPAITRVEGGEFLALLIPSNRKISFN